MCEGRRAGEVEVEIAGQVRPSFLWGVDKVSLYVWDVDVDVSRGVVLSHHMQRVRCVAGAGQKRSGDLIHVKAARDESVVMYMEMSALGLRHVSRELMRDEAAGATQRAP